MKKRSALEVADLLAKVAQQLGYTLELVTISCDEDENFRVGFTSFNPHFQRCKCESCKRNVAIIKKRVASCGAYGESITTAHDPNPLTVN